MEYMFRTREMLNMYKIFAGIPEGRRTRKRRMILKWILIGH
jgi:hypothetical protein